MQSPYSPCASRRRRQFLLSMAFVIGVGILGLGVPAVRASVGAYLGLTAAPSNEMPAGAVTLAAVTPEMTRAAPTAVLPRPTRTAAANPGAADAAVPTKTVISTAVSTAVATALAPIVEQPEAISQLTEQAGWKVLSPGYLPAGYHFESAYLDTNQQMVLLTYLVTRPLEGAADPGLTASKTITVAQALRNDFIPLQVAPAAVVQNAVVAGQPAAFVVGAWDTQFVKDENDPQGGKMVSIWSNELPVKNLFWQIGKVYLVLVTDDDLVSEQQLILMAARTGQSR